MMRIPGRKKILMSVLSAFLILSGCDSREEKIASEEFTEWRGEGAQSEKRIESLKAGLYENPENFELLSALGDAYFESERYNDAIAEYDKALKIKPEDADCLNDRGLAYLYLGNSEKALASIDDAIKANPTYKHAWLSKGFVLMSLERYDEAVEPLNKVKALDPIGPLGADADNFLSRINVIKGQQ